MLTGIIVGQRVDNKEWEGKKYANGVLLVSSGKRTFNVVTSLKEGEVPVEYPEFAQVSVLVDHAMTDKGSITVRGTITVAA